MNLKARWILLSLLFFLPYLVLGVMGFLWLWERDIAWVWMAGTALLSLISWPFLRMLQRRTGRPLKAKVSENENWSPAGVAAWNDVEQIAARPELGNLKFDEPEPIWNLSREILDSVARKFHPKSKDPMLEVPLPHVFRVVELVSHDLRIAFSQNVPGSHLLTIHDLNRLKRIASLAPQLYRFYRIASAALNPAAALARELNAYVQGQLVNASAQDTKLWAIQLAVKKAGFYAIELYSGNLVLDEVEFTPFTSESSRKSLSLEQKRDDALNAEPLRFLLLGQVKAGKSSLVNALFGETRAAVDIVPRTRNVEPYLLERDGIQQAIILDTAGYDAPSHAADALKQARGEILKCDLILLVVSAKTAARDADHRMLDEIRTLFQDHPDRTMPPVVVALTHIDQLRPFREWTPPYDISEPTAPKAIQIRESLDATASDLELDAGRVIPVCLADGDHYNVDEGMVPAILESLDAARRAKYLRCLREFKDEETWKRLRAQAGNAGRILVRGSLEAFNAAGRRLADLARKPD